MKVRWKLTGRMARVDFLYGIVARMIRGTRKREGRKRKSQVGQRKSVYFFGFGREDEVSLIA